MLGFPIPNSSPCVSILECHMLILQQLATKFPGCHELKTEYGRRGAMEYATTAANTAARKARRIQNVVFTVGAAPAESDHSGELPDLEEFSPIVRTRDGSILPSTLSIVCTHSEDQNEPLGRTICKECVSAAEQRLWASTRGQYAISNGEPLESQGRHVLYTNEQGSTMRDSFKEYSKPEIIVVLRGLSASKLPSVAQPMFIAQDPNLFWPVVSYVQLSAFNCLPPLELIPCFCAGTLAQSGRHSLRRGLKTCPRCNGGSA